MDNSKPYLTITDSLQIAVNVLRGRGEGMPVGVVDPAKVPDIHVKAAETLESHLLASQIKVRPASELLDTSCGTALFGGTGVGKSTALRHVFEQHVRNNTSCGSGRPCLVITCGMAHWASLGADLQLTVTNFHLDDGEFDKIPHAHSGVVFADANDLEMLHTHILQWALVNQSKCPVLIIDDFIDHFGNTGATNELLGKLPGSLTLIWSAQNADNLPSGIMSLTPRIVAMKINPCRARRTISKLAFDLGHPAVNAFEDAVNKLEPYQAVSFERQNAIGDVCSD